MTRSSFVKFEGKYFGPITNGTNTSLMTGSTSQYLSQDIGEAKVLISTCLTFVTGIFHVSVIKNVSYNIHNKILKMYILKLLFALFHVGFVTKYISETIVQGFTCGAAFHMIASQIGALIGFKIPTVTIPYKFVGVR